MAQLSQLAYKGKNSKSNFQKLGYTGHKYFDVDGAQCHAVWNDEEYCLYHHKEIKRQELQNKFYDTI